MIMKKAISFILTVVLVVSVTFTVYAKNDKDDGIKAKSAILMCMDTNEVLYSKNEKEHLSPASVTKI
ncbi:MAG: D-alanyl-D-alanine carboxypeptidase, partial [Ruminococcaceae bacterium]|nr:D-alanyl-D-alanine carboxypeptidase [Oscillospiraceae bacterium]